MPVYLLHFDRALGGEGRASARHYLGYVAGGPDNLTQRLSDHLGGRSDAKICQAFFIAGARGQLVHVWPGGDKGTERRLKNGGRFPDYCTICRASGYSDGVRRTPGGIPVWPQTTFTR